MRQIVLDTETTGLYPQHGHRIIEIAAIEMGNRSVSKNVFHRYLNPQREIDEEASRVHGLTLERLQDEPLFVDIVPALLEFISGAELIIHNAPFDVGFLNAELERAGLPKLSNYCPSVLDTLALAKELHPGKKNSLDALCDRYEIDNSHRTLHGALLDTELLGEVYLAMTRGQGSLLGEEEEVVAMVAEQVEEVMVKSRLKVVRASEAELAAHQERLVGIDKASKGNCLWLMAAQTTD